MNACQQQSESERVGGSAMSSRPDPSETGGRPSPTQVGVAEMAQLSETCGALAPGQVPCGVLTPGQGGSSCSGDEQQL